MKIEVDDGVEHPRLVLDQTERGEGAEVLPVGSRQGLRQLGAQHVLELRGVDLGGRNGL
jgi:hypothetical protein